MINTYTPILLMLAVGVIVALVMVVISWVAGPKRPTPYKQSVYECGVEPIGNVHERFPVKFYLVAILLILFDVESIFLYAWYSVFNNPAAFSSAEAWQNFKVFTFFEVGIFILILIVGLLYIIRKDALVFDDPSDLVPVKKVAASAVAEPTLSANEVIE